MWLVLQPILVIGMLCNDKLFVAAVMAALAARFTSRLHFELDPVFRRRTASQIKSHNRNSSHSSDHLVGAGEQSAGLHCRLSRPGTSRRSISPMSAVRFASATVNSCLASFA